MDAGGLIREARRSAGLTQTELARRAGTSQAAISRYESGTSSPSVATLQRLLAACGKHLRLDLDERTPTGVGPIGRTVRSRRRELRQTLATHGARNPRVFGSVARGTDRADSDLDLLVELPRPSYVLLAKLQQAIEEATGLSVDVSTPSLLREDIRDRVLAEAVPL